LLEVLEALHHEIEINGNELNHGWGAIIVSDNQDGLRRMDIVISWDGVVIESGSAVIENGEAVALAVLDDAGSPILNEAGEEVYAHRISAVHIFIHEDSAYFD